MIILLDNYDSFTYNLYDYLLQCGAEVQVVRNDEWPVERFDDPLIQGVVISPGPKRPKDAGITMEFVAKYCEQLPILGICLGFQAIGMHFGARLVKGYPVHGKTSKITHTEGTLFDGLPKEMVVMRYHSLVLRGLETTPLKVTAATENGIPMAFNHPDFPLYGVQFHPESVLTPSGLRIISNWLSVVHDKPAISHGIGQKC